MNESPDSHERHAKRRIATLGALALLLLATPASAQTFRANYALSIIGLSIGNAYATADLQPNAYKIDIGVKLGGVAPENPGRGLPRITGVFVLFDGPTLEPVALLDAPELTALRTPAVSAAIVDLIAPPEASRLVVFGSGPQAVRHVEAGDDAGADGHVTPPPPR